MRPLAALRIGRALVTVSMLTVLMSTVFTGAPSILARSASASASDASGGSLPMGLCTTSANAVVAVDFAHWGGPIVRSCGSTPTSGFDLVNEGGFHTVGTQHDGPGFVCRISSSSFGGTDYPRASEPGESCVFTPPATGYWSYWHANAGQNSWSYSTTGATEYRPEPGSVDLWVFGATSTGGGSGSGVPSFSPDAVRARNTAPSYPDPPTTPAHPSSTGRPARPRSSVTRASVAHPTATHPSATHGTTRPTAAPTTPRPAPRTSFRTPSASTSVPTIRATAAATPTVIDATPVSAKRASSGSVWPVLITVVVVAFLVGGAGATVLRRRRSS